MRMEPLADYLDLSAGRGKAKAPRLNVDDWHARAPETREEWLNKATDKLRPLFEAAGYKVPANVRNTCGFPSKSALANKKQRIGECWSDSASEGKVFEIFISPVLAKELTVLETLAHELVHATVGLEAKHGSKFSKCAKAIGLEGKMTATTAGKELREKLSDLAKAIGPYPHKRLHGMTSGEKKQGTRLIKCECKTCGYTVRTTRSWLEFGAPICPVDDEAMDIEGGTDE
jgi:predicted Zn-ribbon and HTH transcriptional regulator